MANGVEQPYFLRQVQEVSVGDGTAFLWLHYAASNAPLGLHTDAMRIELLAGSGGAALGSATVVTSVILPFDKWWLRPEGRTLTIDALAARSEEPGALSLPVPLTITLSQNQVITGFAPSTIAVPVTTSVMIQTSSRYNMGKDTAIFDLWTANGVGAGLAPSTMITITDNIVLTAHYAISEKQQVYLPLVIR
jgi:hypothetical protein